MVVKSQDHPVEVVEGKYGGHGKVTFKKMISSPEELYGKGRVFAVVTLERGGEFGVHEHKNEEEFYHILSGTGRYYDNGDFIDVGPGDTTICKPGESHGIVNTGDGDLQYIALIIHE